MGSQFRLGVLAAVALLCLPAHADSLQCNGGMVREGDSRASLLQKCGQPQAQDSFCAPVIENRALVPAPQAGGAAPCQQVDDWIYSPTPNQPAATVRIRSGAVQSIRLQRQPR